jgi:hypothetical protein
VIRQPKPELSKVNAVDIIPACRRAGSVARVYSFSPSRRFGMQMISDISMTTYFSAGIAENPNVMRRPVI